ncbi:MAG: hypothetical protein PUC59_09710, partial [Firmicutes bacterium]|nr:hypothetical protein [Bacillota bacterium]
GHNRYAVYFADDAQPMAIRVKVTAENGGTQEYTLVMAKEAAAEAGKQLLAELEQEADREAAGKVVEAIDAIGTVTTESEQAIRDARAAYDALTDAQKALVSNYKTLTDAEAALARLKSEEAAGIPATGGSSPVFAALMTGLFGLASAAVSFRKKQQTGSR